MKKLFYTASHVEELNKQLDAKTESLQVCLDLISEIKTILNVETGQSVVEKVRILASRK